MAMILVASSFFVFSYTSSREKSRLTGLAASVPVGKCAEGYGCQGTCAKLSEPHPDSCQGKCGGYNPNGNCWCDSGCVGYGDCCSDYQLKCGGGITGHATGDPSGPVQKCPEGYGCAGICVLLFTTTTPTTTSPPGNVSGTCSSGYCGIKAPAGCYCDSACVNYGDCCADYQTICVGGGQPFPTTTISVGCNYDGVCSLGVDGKCSICSDCCIGWCGDGNCDVDALYVLNPETPDTCPSDCGGGGYGYEYQYEYQYQTPSGEYSTCSDGYCGTKAPAGCWCDDGCVTYGDCCADYKQVCLGAATTTTTVPTSGIFLPLTQGDSIKVTAGGTSYIVTLNGVSDADTIVLTVGSYTKSIDKGVTATVGGLSVYVKDVYFYGSMRTDNQAYILFVSASKVEPITTTTIPPTTTTTLSSKNSCVGKCGGNAGSCWCDAGCVKFGDCCADYQSACNGGGYSGGEYSGGETPSGGTMEENTDRYGGDFYTYVNEDPALRTAEDCRIACNSDSVCKAWTFVKSEGRCWEKSSVPAPIYDTCCISGTK